MTTVALGEIVDFYSGGTPSKASDRFWRGDVPWISAKDMKHARLTRSIDHVSDEVFSLTSLRKLPPGTVVMVVRGMILAHTIPIGILEVAAAINQDLKALLPREGVVPAYLAGLLRAQQAAMLAQVSTAAHGTKKLESRVLEQIRIPLPSIDEQRRIADILDRADALRDKRRQALALLDDLTQSIFHDMFGDVRTNPHEWEVAKVGDVAERVTDGEHKTPRRTEFGIPLLSARNVRDGWIDFDNVDFIDEAEYENLSRRIEPRAGDILISCSGTIGRVAQVPKDARFAMVRSTALVRPKLTMDSTFMESLLASPNLRATMQAQANSSAQANLFQNQIKRLPVFVPPMARQINFARRVDQVNSQRAAVRAAAAADAELFGSLQQRAFAGLL